MSIELNSREVKSDKSIGSQMIINPLQKARFRMKNIISSEFKMPSRAIFTFDRNILTADTHGYEISKVNYSSSIEIRLLTKKSEQLAIIYPLMGSYASIVLEEIIALGVNSLVFIGGAGFLDSNVTPGTILLPTAAIKDEGVSALYDESPSMAFPCADLVSSIRDEIISEDMDYEEGITWTIASYYRILPDILKYHIRQGAISVELEAASLFCVANYNNIRTAGVFIAYDQVCENGWKPPSDIHERIIRSNLERLLNIAIRVVVES